MNQTKLLELVAISQIEGIGPQKIKYIIKLTDQLDSIWEIDPTTLEKIIGSKLVPEFLARRKAFNPEQEIDKINQSGSKLIFIEEKDYPLLLKEIPDCPPFLFVKGDLEILRLSSKKLAVVGSRKYSSYGQEVIFKIIPPLATSGVIIVSGLALGIDALAHQGTVEAKGKTVAVLGSSIDFIYPVENYHLAERILNSGGLLLSEFPPGTPPLKQHFPRRNRIIAGISDGVLVIEAAMESGSLITARLALDYNRDVFAIPGDIFRETAYGVNKLIQDGAILTTNAEDILTNWQISSKLEKDKIIIRPLSPAEEALLKLLSGEPMPIDEIGEKAGIPASQSAQLLSQLELAGIVKDVGGGYYQRK